MASPDTAGPFSVEARRDGVPGLVVLSGAAGRIIIAGYAGAALPLVVTRPEFVRRAAAAAASGWTLTCDEGTYEFVARAVEWQAPRPRLFEELLAPHAPAWGERLAARCLLRLIRWPGGARLLRAWHARRG